MNFQTILMPKVFWQNFCHKKSTHLDHSYLKYALKTLTNQNPNQAPTSLDSALVCSLIHIFPAIFMTDAYHLFCSVLFCSMDRVNQFGCFAPFCAFFGSALPAQKRPIDGRGGRPCHVLVITFCLICQAFRPNIPQVRMIDFRTKSSKYDKDV